MDESKVVIDDLYKEKNNSKNDRSSILEPDELRAPDSGIDSQVEAIYQQASEHRNILVFYYINYTYWFSAAVVLLIFIQAAVRILTEHRNFEIMPQWSLNILVTGMFVQFIGLLKIVTENVWNFKSFFSHHNHILKKGKTP